MKKIFSFVIVLATAAMVSCCGNANKKAAAEGAAEAAATEAVAAEAAACDSCTVKCDSTATCCAEQAADSTAVEAAK